MNSQLQRGKKPGEASKVITSDQFNLKRESQQSLRQSLTDQSLIMNTLSHTCLYFDQRQGNWWFVELLELVISGNSGISVQNLLQWRYMFHNLHISLRIRFTLEHFRLHHYIHTVFAINCVSASFAKVHYVALIYASGGNMFVVKKKKEKEKEKKNCSVFRYWHFTMPLSIISIVSDMRQHFFIVESVILD